MLSKNNSIGNRNSFDMSWEKYIYSQNRHLNEYPYDILVSIVMKKFPNNTNKLRKQIPVLDLGCGAGNNARFLAEKGFNVYGIDGSKKAISICKDRFKNWGLECEFKAGDFLKLPYSDDFFKLIVDRESLCANKYIDIKKILFQIYKKLQKHGVLISFFYNIDHPDIRFGKQIEPNTYTDFKEGTFKKTGNVHFLDYSEIQDLFHKFRIENIIKHTLCETFNKKGRLIEFSEYIIIATK